MAQRVTYRRRLSYNTRSNKIRKVKAPGGRLVAQYISKKAGPVKCGDCGKKLQGNPSTAPKARKQITRVYGGSRCGKCVKERIIRAFLIEEREIVKYLLKSNKLR